MLVRVSELEHGGAKMEGFDYAFLLLWILLAIGMIVAIPDELYFKQIAKDNANSYCSGLWFDK